MNTHELKYILSQFAVTDQKVRYKQVTQGYINETYLILIDKVPQFILQSLNQNVFKNIEQLHRNMELALGKLIAPDYHKINLFKTKTGESFLSHNGQYWRLTSFVENSKAYNITTNLKIAFETGRIIGRFHTLLQDAPVHEFIETVPNLNYLPFRENEFKEALKNSSDTRKGKAKEQIKFAQETLRKFDEFYTAKLPYRVCHNDTKLNNILFDKSSNDALCLIDLDTIMNGYFHYDFGDAVRTVVSTANEDETDFSKITFSKPLFESFIEGLKSNGQLLNDKEIGLLPISAALMPFMHGLRALTDYLNNNIYYKVAYETQNLDRSKSLFYFSKLALQHISFMKTMVVSKLK